MVVQLPLHSNKAELELVGDGCKWSNEGGELAAILMRNQKEEEKKCTRHFVIPRIKSRKEFRKFSACLLLASSLLTITASPGKAGVASEIAEAIIKYGSRIAINWGTRNPDLAPFIWTAIGTLVGAAIIYSLLKSLKKWEEDRELSSRIYIDETSSGSKISNNSKWAFIAGLLILGGIAANLLWQDLARKETATNSYSKSEKIPGEEDLPKPEWWEKGSDPKSFPGKEWWPNEEKPENKSSRAKKYPAPLPPQDRDPAVAMQSRVYYFPSDNLHTLNTTDYKKVSGDLARVQQKLLIKRSRANEFPEVLIGQGSWRTENCNKFLPTIGSYQYGGTDCDQLITVNFTDGNRWYEHQIEVIITLAHEWGHHIINLSGERISRISNELLSDCFAGVYLAYLHKHGALTEDEFYKGVRMMTQIGNTHGTGIHGSKAQRANGLISGYKYSFKQNDQESQANWNSYCKGLENVIDLSKGLP